MAGRRDILKGMLYGGMTAMAASVLSPLDAFAADRDLVDVTLTSRPMRFQPKPGLSIDSLAFNGQIPGPLLRLRYGQRLRARYINHSGGPSTIHWHGMILPNAMDGVPYVTQPPVPDGGEFTYEFTPGPPGFRWYHSHVVPQAPLGLFGGFIVDDPSEPQADVEAVLVFHDVPNMHSYHAALNDLSHAHMVDPKGSPAMVRMMKARARGAPMMGDEVAYRARCINGAIWPHTRPIEAKVGQTVRLRILNASPTITHYIAMGGHALQVTHSDGNRLPQPVTVDALRVGVAERYDAWFTITEPGAWRIEAIANDGYALGQSVVVHTPGKAHLDPVAPDESLMGKDWFTYLEAGNAAPQSRPLAPGPVDVSTTLTLGEGPPGAGQWTINGKTWPHTDDIRVHRNDRVLVHFKNPTDMDHPMHLHGHVFHLVEINGRPLQQPLPKDTVLVPAEGGTATWLFTANAPAGRWMLHCHNEIHMADGMMTAVRYI